MEKETAKPRAVVKSATAFRTISEVSEELEVPQHVLRFWETKFPQVRPLKRGGGRRYYRPEDVALLRRIQRLLYSEGYTIKGVQRLLKDSRLAGEEAANDVDMDVDAEVEAALDATPGTDADADAVADALAEDLLDAELDTPEPAVAPLRPGDGKSLEPSAGEPRVAEPRAPEPRAPEPRVLESCVPEPRSLSSRVAWTSPVPPPVATPVPAPLVAQAAAPVMPPRPTPPMAIEPAATPTAVESTEPPATLSAWQRRELTSLRAELIDIKVLLRRAIR